MATSNILKVKEWKNKHSPQFILLAEFDFQSAGRFSDKLVFHKKLVYQRILTNQHSTFEITKFHEDGIHIDYNSEFWSGGSGGVGGGTIEINQLILTYDKDFKPQIKINFS